MNWLDAWLVDRFRRGDRRAFDKLYDRYSRPVFAFSLRLSGSREEAEDLVQDAFVALVTGVERYRGRGKLSTWLFRAALFAHNNGRRRQVQVRQLLDGEEWAASAECTVWLDEALGELTGPQREAFWLVRMGGWSHREAAEALAAPPGTIQSRVHEATRRLRAYLEAGQ
jgi:RNA polymerase sigma-70 factor (ECF subfamily)